MAFVFILVFRNPHALPLLWRYTSWSNLFSIDGGCTEDSVLSLVYGNAFNLVQISVLCTTSKKVYL